MKNIILNYGKRVLGAFCFASLSLVSVPLNAQQVTVRASIDSLQLLVGE